MFPVLAMGKYCKMTEIIAEPKNYQYVLVTLYCLFSGLRIGNFTFKEHSSM